MQTRLLTAGFMSGTRGWGLLLLCWLLPPGAAAQSASISLFQGSPASVSPGGRISFSFRVTNTGSDSWASVWAPSSPQACVQLVDSATQASCIQAAGYRAGQYAIRLVAFKMDVGSPFATQPWNALIPLPGTVAAGQSVDVSNYVLAPPLTSPYTLAAWMIDGYHGFASRTLVSPEDGYNNSPHVSFTVGTTTTCTSPTISTQPQSQSVTSTPTPAFTAGSVVNAASQQPGLVPGSLAIIYGTNLASTTAQATTTAWPTTLGGASVLVGGLVAPLYYASSTQINFQVPWELQGQVEVTVAVMNNAVPSQGVNVPVLLAQPGIFTINGRQGLAYNYGSAVRKNGTLVTAIDPARPGDVIVLYATGLGAVSPQQQTGVPTSTSASITGDIRVFVAGSQADIRFAGLVQGYIGLYQLNVVVPSVLSDESLTVRVGEAQGSATIAAAAVGAWIETFDTLDPERWQKTSATRVEGTSPTNGCTACNSSSFDPGYVQTANGYLILRLDQWLQSPYPLARIVSVGGELSSVEQFSYGTYEFRIRMSSTATTPAGAGTCLPGSVSGAFNLLYDSATKLSETEIDFEGLGDQPDRVNTTSWHGAARQQTGTIPVPHLCEQFFTYRFTWEPGEPDRVSFSVDGSPNPPPFTTTVPIKPAAIILNHWGTIDAGWGGDPNTDATGQAFSKPRFLYVDWVKFTPRAQ